MPTSIREAIIALVGAVVTSADGAAGAAGAMTGRGNRLTNAARLSSGC
jgi:hypothetical protein